MPAAWELWSGAIYLILRFALALAVVAAVCRRGTARAWWLGFAAFGWIYMGASFEFDQFDQKLPTQLLLHAPGQPLFTTLEKLGPPWLVNFGSLYLVWHTFWTLLAALSGATLARTTFRAMTDGKDELPPSSESAARRLPARPVGPALLFFSVLVLAALVGFGGAILAPAYWAGLTFFLMWWLLALATVWACCGQGKRRVRWLGASLLGAGFLILAFGRPAHDPWPILPTVALLDDLRPWVPTAMNGYPAGLDVSAPVNARTHTALERRSKMHDANETPLEDLLKDIQNQTADSGGKAIRIEVVPLDRGEVNLTMTPTVRMIELDDVPLRTSLRLALQQLDLTYRVRDGVLMIYDRESDEEYLLSIGRTAYQTVGHCLLALMAAGIGGVLAPLLCDWRPRRLGADASP
jgi:hypothetical protein